MVGEACFNSLCSKSAQGLMITNERERALPHCKWSTSMHDDTYNQLPLGYLWKMTITYGPKKRLFIYACFLKMPTFLFAKTTRQQRLEKLYDDVIRLVSWMVLLMHVVFDTVESNTSDKFISLHTTHEIHRQPLFLCVFVSFPLSFNYRVDDKLGQKDIS